MAVTIGMLYPGFGAEDDYPFMEELLGEGIHLPLVHTSVGVDAHEVQALLLPTAHAPAPASSSAGKAPTSRPARSRKPSGCRCPPRPWPSLPPARRWT